MRPFYAFKKGIKETVMNSSEKVVTAPYKLMGYMVDVPRVIKDLARLTTIIKPETFNSIVDTVCSDPKIAAGIKAAYALLASIGQDLDSAKVTKPEQMQKLVIEHANAKQCSQIN